MKVEWRKRDRLNGVCWIDIYLDGRLVGFLSKEGNYRVCNLYAWVGNIQMLEYILNEY